MEGGGDEDLGSAAAACYSPQADAAMKSFSTSSTPHLWECVDLSRRLLAAFALVKYPRVESLRSSPRVTLYDPGHAAPLTGAHTDVWSGGLKRRLRTRGGNVCVCGEGGKSLACVAVQGPAD